MVVVAYDLLAVSVIGSTAIENVEGYVYASLATA